MWKKEKIVMMVITVIPIVVPTSVKTPDVEMV